MMRPVLGLAAVACLFAMSGCATDRPMSISQMLGWEDPPARPSKMPKADLAIAERVETLGRKIITQNTFTGIEPLFHTVGVKELVLFHRGQGELFVSEGIAKECKTDNELAAVLCSELALMMTEKQAARRVGVDRDSIPEVAIPTDSGLAGGTPVDPARAAERAFQE